MRGSVTQSHVCVLWVTLQRLPSPSARRALTCLSRLHACSCNTLAYANSISIDEVQLVLYARTVQLSISIDEVQLVLYGRKLGLPLPARGPWSYLSAEGIKAVDIPWLDQQWCLRAGAPGCVRGD